MKPDKPQSYRNSRSLDEKRWEKNFEYARKYYDIHKNLDIPSSYNVEDGSDLGQWLTRQKNKLIDGTLDPKRVERLAGIGLAADNPKLSKAERWEKNFELARKYYEANKNLNIPGHYMAEDGSDLGQWLSRQRKKLNDGSLAPERVEKLASIGLVAEIKNAQKPKPHEEKRPKQRQSGIETLSVGWNRP